MTEETKALAPIERVKKLITQDSIQQRFKEVLKERAPAFISSIISAVASNASLAEAEPMSIISAGIVAATLDLPINPSLGWAHIVAYKGKAQFQMGKGGYVQLALRSGQYETINHTVIYEGQIVKHDSFTGDMELQEAKKSDKVVGYLLYFRLLNGYRKFFYMTVEQCKAHAKKYSQSFNNGKGLWVNDFDSMGLKTVTKLGLAKYGVLSIQMQKAIQVDEAVVDEDGRVREYVDAIETHEALTQTPGVSKKLGAVIEAQGKTEQAPI